MATTAQTIQGYYNTILGRTGSVTEVAYWVNQVDNGGIPLSQVETDFATSHEALTNVAPIVEMYQADLGRAPDNAGLTYWVGLEESGTSLATIGADIAASAESQAHNGFTVGAAPTTASVTSAYESILGRPPESAAVVASWVASGLSGAQIVAAISGSAEAQADYKSAVSTYLSTGGGTTSNSVTLAPGVDHAVGTTIVGSLSPFFYDGVGPTLNSGDTVTGSGSNNTLTLADGYGAGADIIPAGITISNIQNVGLQTAGNAGSGGSPFDTSPYGSVTSTTVTSSGGGADIVQASSTSTITVNHNSTAGSVQTYGGSNTTVSTNGTAGVTVGGNGVNQLPAATGTITVNANGAGVGAGAVTVLGGGAVNVTVATASATGNINVGNTGLSSLTKADNPSGAINIVSNSLAGAGNVETILGGTAVTVAAKGDTIGIGDATATTASNQPSGAVTVTDLLPIAYDGLTGPGTTHNATKGGAITVNGGTNVSVTTNTGGGVAVGTGGKAGTYATGTVTVTDTSSNLKGAFGIGTPQPTTTVVGGTGVTVNEAGGNVTIGSATAAADPSGAISVTETAASQAAISIDGGSGVTVAAQGQGVTVGSLSGTSGAQSITQASVYSGKALGSSNVLSAVTDDGGTTVTVNTTGGNVAVGSATHAPTGAVTINNTFSGAGTANASTVTVLGGAAVGITETNTTSGTITVGQVPVLNSVGTAVKNLASDPTGNVTINNSVTNGTTTTYGTSATNVYTNGATAVSVTGAGATTIADANDFTPTSGTVGTSTLATVNLDGVAGAVTINSGALTALTIADSLKGATAATTVTTGAGTGGFSAEGAHTLALTLSNDSNTGTSVTDPTATALTIGTTGTTADNIGITAAKATSLTFNNAAALTVAAGATMATSGTDTITATGAGALTLGNTTGWTGAGNLASINASTASGAVTAEINGNVTAFTGGSGNDVVTVDTGAGKTINGGTGSNTVILTAAAIAYNPVATPGSAISADFTNFQTLGLAAGATGAYDVSGFSGVTIAALLAATTLTNAGAGETLTFTGTQTGPTSWALKTDTSNDALNVTVGVDGTATTSTKGISAGTLNTTGIETITVNSVGASTTVASPTTDQNTIVLTDAGTKTLDVTGHANVAVTDTGGGITAINVTSTAAADVSGVVAAAGGVTITGGAGLLTASTADTVNATAAAKGAQVDSVTTGAGGGIITVGGGGGWVQTPLLNTGAYSAGSETINLSASAGVTDTLDVADGAISTFNGTKGGITGFVTGVSLSDQLTYTAASKTVISNVTAPVGVMTVNGAVNAAGVLGAGLAAVLANLNYTVSNGVITFSASGGHVLSDFTTGQLVSAAEIIVNGAASQIAMFSTGGSTYVVTDDATRTLATTAVGANADSITDLVGTSGILGFGSTDAANTVVVTDLNTVSAGNTGSATASNTYNDTGFARDNFTAAGVATTVAATGVTTYNNLAASAELDIGNTGALHIGSIVTTQVGASGSDSLTVQTNTNSVIIDSLTVAGDSLVKFDPSTGNLNNTVSQLIDSTNTMKTITVAGNGNSSTTLDLAAITGTALTTIDATIALAAVTLGDGAALSQAGLTVLGGVNAVTIGNWTTTPLGSLGLSGANDVVTIGSLAASNTAIDKVFASGAANTITVYGNTANVTTVTASGAGDIISAGVGVNTITANGAGDTITVGNSAATASVATSQTIHASGVGDAITFASKTTPTSGATGSAITYTGASTIDGGLPGIGIGNNSTVNFGTNTGVGTENVVLTGDVTGATSSGSYAFITLNNLGFGDSMTFSNATNEVAAGGTFGASQVNVASTTTLAGALDLAAATDAMSQQSGTTAAGLINANTGVLDWFQFGGNTYITEAVNSTSAAATHTALGAGDAVVKIGGLVDLSGYNLSGHTVNSLV